MSSIRPNILYLHSHDTGRYLQPYGYAIPTPNIQRLAQEGTLFRQAFCAAPTCSPSRAALLTGQSPHRCGMLGLAHRGYSLDDYSMLIVHTLRQAGYHSVLTGVQHVAKSETPHLLGYDSVLGSESKDAEMRAAEFLAQQPRQPFFLDVGFIETHRVRITGEFVRGGAADARYVRPPEFVQDTPAGRADMADFIASAGILDGKYGVVLAALKKAGLAANTLVICTTDHGIPFPHGKCRLTDHGLGVSLIMRGPGGFEGGRVIDGMVSQIDLFPTICQWLGIAAPEWLEGKSMLPLVQGQTQEINQEIFGEVTYHAAYEPMRCVRTKRWKYIRRYDGRSRGVLPNTDPGPAREELIAHGWAAQPVAEEEFYDLLMDPAEANNLAVLAAWAPQLVSADAAAALPEMRQRLQRWMERTADPLLHGPVPPKSGSVMNLPDQLDHEDPPTIVP